MALLASIQKDIKWRLSDPVSLVMWIGIPVLIGGMMGLVFGGRGPSPKVKLLLADQDDNFITQMIPSAADRTGVIQVEKVVEAAGRRRIGEGDGSAFLLIPEGFTEAALNGKPCELELLINPSQTVGPQIVQGILETGVDAHHYLHLIAGDMLRDMAEPPPAGDNTFLTFAAKGIQMMNHVRKLSRLEKLFDPLILSVEDELTQAQKEKKAGTAKTFNFGIFLFPGILFMSLMFIAQGITYDLWREKDLGTLSRLLCSPTSAATFMLSKMISGTLVIAAVAASGLLLGYFTFDLPLSVLPGALLWIAFAGTSLLAMFFVIQTFASSSRGANVLTSALVFPLMMIGGSFIPFGSMPSGMAAIGKSTPNGLGVAQLNKILLGQIDSGALLTTALQLGVFTLVLFALATRLLRTRLVTR